MKKLSLVFTIFACFFIFSLKPKAFNVDYATVTYNYNDVFVVDNHNTEFFGENGYLEIIRKNLTPRFTGSGMGFQILFTKDDIYVHKCFSCSKLSFDILYLYNSDIGFTASSNGNDNRFYSLSSYDSFSSFYNAVLSGSRPYSNNLYSFPYDSEITSDINYFDLDPDNYIIPYYVYHTDDSNLYVSSSSSNAIWPYYPLSIYGTEYKNGEVMPTYHDLFGFEEPSAGLSVDTSLVYNNAFIIDSNYLNEVSGSYEFIFKSSVPPRVSDLEFYGLVNDNGLYHYELLSSNVLSLVNGSNVNFGDDDFDSSSVIFSYNGSKAVFSIASNSFIYTDLSRYESIYIKVNYDDPVLILNSSFNYHNDSPYIYSTIVNDVCAECLYTQMTSTFSNTVMFSADVEDSSTKLYFRDVSYLSSTIGQTLTLEYKPEYHSTVTNSFLSNDVHYYSRDYFYDTFNRVIFDNYNISPDVSLLMSLYQPSIETPYKCNNWFCKIIRHIPFVDLLFFSSDNISDIPVSGDVMLMFYISDNVYFGNTVYSSDKTHVEGVSTNGHGGVTHFSEEGDWSKVSTDYSFSNMFNNAVNESSDVLSAGAELLSLSTSLFTIFSPTVRYVLLLLFLFGALILFIKSIM